MTPPKKIRLLRNFAGYPEGEYKRLKSNLYWMKVIEWGGSWFLTIHPDIIEATEGKGIWEEVVEWFCKWCGWDNRCYCWATAYDPQQAPKCRWEG